MNEKHIYVLYLDIRNISNDLVDEYSLNVTQKFKDTFDGIFIVIPHYNDSKLECINPKYITEKELIEKNKKAIVEMTKKINQFINNEINGEKEN